MFLLNKIQRNLQMFQMEVFNKFHQMTIQEVKNHMIQIRVLKALKVLNQSKIHLRTKEKKKVIQSRQVKRT